MTPDAKILRALRNADRHLPVSELAALAELPPEELPLRIAELAAAGYEIELQPHFGYRLVSSPDRLIADDLAGRLEDAGVQTIGKQILVFEETGSTNDVAMRLGRAGTAEGVAIFAERQTSGRGRLGRRWDSAARQGLWFSLLLRPEGAFSEWSRLTTWAAVGIARGIEEMLPGSRASIKWPNDVYLYGRKAVGILIESASDSVGGNPFAVVGIGINVNQTEFPDELAQRATSLRLASGKEASLDRQMVATAMLRQLDALYPKLGDRFPEIVAEAAQRSLLIGNWVEINTPAATVRGRVEGLEPDGSLQLRREDGSLQAIAGGEVSIGRWGGI